MGGMNGGALNKARNDKLELEITKHEENIFIAQICIETVREPYSP